MDNLPTDKMLEEFFTKPLQGTFFKESDGLLWDGITIASSILNPCLNSRSVLEKIEMGYLILK